MKRKSSLSATCAFVLLAGCNGQIAGNSDHGASPPVGGASGSPGNPGTPGSPGTPGNPGTPGGTEPAANCNAAGATAGALHARLLSPAQYDNTIEDLFHVTGHPAKDFGGGADTQLDDLAAERRANAASTIARQAAATLSAWAPCAPPAVDAATCSTQLIDFVGLRVYRHPLSATERTQLQALLDAGTKDKDFTTGVEWLLTGALQSPDFLYQFAKPAAQESAGSIHPLVGYEMASRLAYFVWDSTPDETLFAAAAKPNGLADRASVEAEITRMLNDQPRFLRGVNSYYDKWLETEGFNELARDDKAFTTELVGALGASLMMSATKLYADAAPNISSLLSGQSYFLNGPLRAFYGKGTGGADFAPVDFAGEGRTGLMTHPALLAQLARPQKTHPINRGLFVRGKLLCQELVQPPGVMIPALPEAPTMGVTTREEVVDHSTKPECSVCHRLLDPPGLALENFDQVGRHRDTENGRPVDTSGKMVESGDLDGDFAKGEDFLKRLSGSATVKGCFAQQYFQFALAGDLARPVADEDRCALDNVRKEFTASGDLKKLVVAIASSDSFRLRKSEGVAP
jgi:hypothetical protein